MNISGIGSYSGNYNSIRINRPVSTPATGIADREQPQAVSDRERVLREQERQQIRANQNFNSEDYAKQYAPGKTYEMKGVDSDISSLDVSGDVSGSKKSQIMQQYQLFMGETQAQGANRAAMNAQAVRGMENFAF